MVNTLTRRWCCIQLMLPVLIAIGFVGCGSGTQTEPPELAGTWVADNIVMTVTDAGAHLELACAHGDIPGAFTQNPFSTAGTFVFEIGPAVVAHPALYTGSVVGATMTFSIRLTDTNESVRSYTLTRGAARLFSKCV
jgi:hypothetical protein